MILGSAWIPDTIGSTTLVVEVNTAYSADEVSCPEHYLSFRKEECSGSKLFFFARLKAYEFSVFPFFVRTAVVCSTANCPMRFTGPFTDKTLTRLDFRTSSQALSIH